MEETPLPSTSILENGSIINSFSQIDASQDENITADKENVIKNDGILQENFIINKTPLWSRRRPQLSNINERTEALSTLCSSYSNVNTKKEDIEELKKMLLLNEIEFKKQLYDLQLQTAAKELEA
ncbi:hypothetical protein evm_013856 [Chilo suppressalis]|nr:hypothetical protein evm_013856 [Chilo suppressalis]